MSACAVFAQTPNILLENYVLHEDFQGDGLGQFANYPPAQDVGYEPSITPTSDFDAPGGRALMRVVKPNRDGAMRLGFIRQTFLRADDGAKISFAYYLNHADANDQIEIGLAGGDGCRYTKEIPAKTGGWTKAEIALTDFRCEANKTLKNGTGIEAFYIVADLKRADADITYRFIIDDVALQAKRAARFDVREPQTVRIESQDATVSAKSYVAGDRISLAAFLSTRLKNAVAAIENQDGKIIASQPLFDDGTHGDERGGDGVWSNNSIYILQKNDPPGVWKIKLQGATAGGESVLTEIRFIHRPAERLAHPRLYFDAGDKQTLVSRTQNPKTAGLWKEILETAKTRRAGDVSRAGKVFEMLDEQYLLPSLTGYFDALSQAYLRIEYNALAAYLTNDAQARESAKKALLDVSRWSRWEPPWFTAHGQHTYYPAGQLAAQVAFGYDLLYDDLTEAERVQVRRALIEKAIIPAYKEYVLDNRVMANTSNWIAHTVGGALIASAAIAGDVTGDEAGGKFDVYLNGLLLKFERHLAASYLADGSYGEGISYQEFDLETTAPALVALRRVFGIDYRDKTRVKDSLAYPLYTFAQPVEGSLDMGDSHPPSARTIAPLVAESKDATLRWFYEQFPHNSVADFIFFDDAIAPKPPSLPSSRIFRNKGNAVFRTGWGKDDSVFLFRAGANFNHNHADQGAFLLTAFGEPLITEAGWSDYYKDPYYATFFTQAIGHNTILVDGDPESQTIPDTPQFKALDDYPRVTDAITSEFFDGVSSELSSVYKNRLERYARRIAFVKPYYFVVFDDLKARGNPRTFDFLLHLPNRAGIETEGAAAIYNGEKASLGVQFFSPDDAKLSVENGRIPYPVFSTRTPAEAPPQPAYLDFKTIKPLRETQFLTALVPARTESAARELINGMTELAGENLKGIRARRGDETDFVMFRMGAGNAAMRQGEWSADASVLTVTTSGDSLKMFAVQNGRVLRRGSQILFSSDSPTSAAVNYDANQIEAICNTDAAAKIVLFSGKNPVRVLLDGRELGANAFSFNRANGTISIDVPAGRHEIKIIL
ncbi:MAG: heparinase II/III domain-containing protein [Pyrinomonadaceae bacterium]